MSSYAIHINVPGLARNIQQEVVHGGSFTFATLDNGNQPFRLTLFPFFIKLGDNSHEKDDTGLSYPRTDRYTGFSIDIKRMSDIWIGTGTYDDESDLTHCRYFGSSALIVIPSRRSSKGALVLVISSDVSAFTLDPGESVVNFVSTVGNSAVPYGWIETTKGKYFVQSFNCTSGFIPSSVNVERPSCVDERHTGFQEIKNLRVLIPRVGD